MIANRLISAVNDADTVAKRIENSFTRAVRAWKMLQKIKFNNDEQRNNKPIRTYIRIRFVFNAYVFTGSYFIIFLAPTPFLNTQRIEFYDTFCVSDSIWKEHENRGKIIDAKYLITRTNFVIFVSRNVYRTAGNRVSRYTRYIGIGFDGAPRPKRVRN